MEPINYKSFWDNKASTKTGAFIAVDGSANEEVARLTGAYTARQVDCALALAPADRVLELGCGVGRIGRELAPKVAHWEGADISANMLGVARDRLAGHANVGLTELRRSSLDGVAADSFSKAYCVAVFIHMRSISSSRRASAHSTRCVFSVDGSTPCAVASLLRYATKSS